MQPQFQSPVNPIPPVVLVLFAAIVVPELIFQVGGGGLVGGAEAIGWRSWGMQNFGFFGSVIEQQIATGQWLNIHSTRILTYPFVHGDLIHAAFAGVFVLAIGKFVAEVFSAISMVILFFACTIVGALAFALIFEDAFLIGAYPAAYGFIGAYTFLMWNGLSRAGENQWRAFGLIGFLLGIQLVFGLLFGSDNSWVADLFGFVTGLAISPILAPGGIAALRAKIRR